ncbi:hypothetical protein ACROYT_G024756 [Oculina patagonica]
MALFGIQGALLTFVVLKIVFSISEETCKKIDTCSCMLRNGSVVSLKAVDGGSKPSFTGIQGSNGSGRTFYWNPCTPFSTVSGCDNVMVCQVLTYGFNPAGSQSTSFSVDSDGNVVIAYGSITGGSPSYSRGSKITLKCDPKASGKGSVSRFTETQQSVTSSIYSATFASQYACAKGGVQIVLNLRSASVLAVIIFATYFNIPT